jgi:hypothetical protein
VTQIGRLKLFAIRMHGLDLPGIKPARSIAIHLSILPFCGAKV